MKDIWIRIYGITLTGIIAYLVLTSFGNTFIPFEYVNYPIEDSVRTTETGIAQSISQTLWEHRSLDMMILALLLFITAVCCISVLVPNKTLGGDSA